MKIGLLVALLLTGFPSFLLAQDDPAKAAVDALVKALDGGKDSVLTAQIATLRGSGFKHRGASSAAFLAGGCGVAGCFSTYLVTVTYFQKQVNAQSTIVGAIVSETRSGQFEVIRVLSRTQIDNLLLF